MILTLDQLIIVALSSFCHYTLVLSFPTYDARAVSLGTSEVNPLHAAGDGERHSYDARN